VNRDGYSDVIVGAYLYHGGEVGEGRVFVFHGSPSGLSPEPSWIAEPDAAGSQFGVCVSTAGDVNGDGYSDVIIGADVLDAGEEDAGAAFVYLGGENGLAATAAWSVFGSQAHEQLGRSVSSAGDVNGDGYSDVVIGAWKHAAGQTNEGIAYIYLGSAGGLESSPAWVVEGNVTDLNFGRIVAGGGDVNGDGAADFAIGTFTDYEQRGTARLFLGNQDGGLPRAARQWRTDETAPIAPLGLSDGEDALRLKVLGATPAGRDSVRMEFEVRPLGTAFTGDGLTFGPWIDSGAPVEGVGSRVELSRVYYGLDGQSAYHWRVRVAARSPLFPHSPWQSPAANGWAEMDFRAKPGPVEASAAPAPSEVVRALELDEARPNPFVGETVLRFALPAAGPVSLRVYDVQGRRVAELVNGPLPAGRHVVRWDGISSHRQACSAGVYFIRLETVSGVKEERVVLIE